MKILTMISNLCEQDLLLLPCIIIIAYDRRDLNVGTYFILILSINIYLVILNLVYLIS